MPRPSLSRALLAALLVTAAFAATASSASAATCTPVLYDAQDWGWDLMANGAVDTGVGDAFDGYGVLRVDGNEYPAAGADACGREDADREVTYPAVAMSGLNVSRKVYVPIDDAFVRWLTILDNPTAAPITVTVAFGGDIGADGNIDVLATSSGDEVTGAGDRWMASDDNSGEDPSVGTAFDSTLAVADTLDAFSNPWADTDDVGQADWTSVTVPAGGTYVYMHATLQRAPNRGDDAIAATQRLARGPGTLYTGLSDAERAALRNFPADGDGDADGVLNRADNCPDAANADQLNTDGVADGGDDCDADDDNDTLSDDVETAIGTDPKRADTDGDRVDDNADQCPRQAGDLANGCTSDDRPPSVAFTGPAQNSLLSPAAANVLTATATDDRRVARVLFIDDGAVVCADETAPYTCAYAPGGADVGSNTLSAIAVDTTDQTATAFRVVRLRRFNATRVTATVRPARDRTVPFRFTTTGRVTLPARVTRTQGCRGRVSVQIQSRGNTISTRRTSLTRTCTYRSRVSFVVPSRLYGKRLEIKVRFLGNAVVNAKRAPARRVRVG